MHSPTATRKPLAVTAVLGLLVVLLSMLAPAAGGGPVVRAEVAVHAMAAHDGAFRLPSPAAPERPDAAVAALLPPLLLAAFVLLAQVPPRERPGWPPPSAAVLPQRTRAPPATP